MKLTNKAGVEVGVCQLKASVTTEFRPGLLQLLLPYNNFRSAKWWPHRYITFDYHPFHLSTPSSVHQYDWQLCSVHISVVCPTLSYQTPWPNIWNLLSPLDSNIWTLLTSWLFSATSTLWPFAGRWCLKSKETDQCCAIRKRSAFI